MRAALHLRTSFKPGGFPAISRWLSEATPPEPRGMKRRSQRDRSECVPFENGVAGILSGCVSPFARVRWCRSFVAQPPANRLDAFGIAGHSVFPWRVAVMWRLMFGISFALFSSCGHPACAADASSKKPNVLFIAIDDLKPLLGCYGASWIKSPNIDRLASRGTRFSANYCQVSFCAPSRFSLLTGLRPDTTHIVVNPAKQDDLLRKRFPDIVTLPQHFKNNGFLTCVMGKVFDGRTVDDGHDTASWSVPYVRRFDEAPGGLGKPPGYQNTSTQQQLTAAAPGTQGPPVESADVPDNAYYDGAMARTGAAKIREFAKAKQPFFLAVGFLRPHLPFIAPKKYWDLYNRAKLPLAPFQTMPVGSPHDLAFYSNSGELRAWSDVPKTGPIPEALQRELIHGYAASVSYSDANVGLLMAALGESGALENTIVCLWGDHGWHLGEHGHWGKVTNYEDATRAPLIIAAPGHRQGAEVKAITEFLDVYPTLCDLAGLSKPAHLQGTSLTPLLGEVRTTLHEAAISQMTPNASKDGVMGWTLRTPRYRYIEWRRADLSTETPRITDQVESVELYDYQTDPLERENLAGKPDHLAALKEQQNLFDKLLPHLPKRLE
jgi:iduronate 2-sulfatase